MSVPFSQPLVPITFEVADESDPGPYPVPLDAPVEGGGDRHVLDAAPGRLQAVRALRRRALRAPAGTPTAARCGT